MIGSFSFKVRFRACFNQLGESCFVKRQTICKNAMSELILTKKIPEILSPPLLMTLQKQVTHSAL